MLTTIAEYHEYLKPIYAQYRNCIRLCISGLNMYAAGLAADHREQELPKLKEFIMSMAEFWSWNSDTYDRSQNNSRMQYSDAFDKSVTEAKEKGAPALTEEIKDDILSGLILYAAYMYSNGESGIYFHDCNALVHRLKNEWAGDKENSFEGRDMTM